MYHKVERPFSGGGVQRLIGEVLNPDAWRTGRRLVDQRYLSAGVVTTTPNACECGRFWLADVPEHGCEEAAAEVKKEARRLARAAR